jgi:hypothetical protein
MKIINYSDFFLQIFFVISIIYIIKNTCLISNHDFVIINKKVFCKKCGLIKEIIKNE